MASGSCELERKAKEMLNIFDTRAIKRAERREMRNRLRDRKQGLRMLRDLRKLYNGRNRGDIHAVARACTLADNIVLHLPIYALNHAELVEANDMVRAIREAC